MKKFDEDDFCQVDAPKNKIKKAIILLNNLSEEQKEAVLLYGENCDENGYKSGQSN